MSYDPVKEKNRVYIKKPPKKDEWMIYNPCELIPIEEFLKNCGFDNES